MTTSARVEGPRWAVAAIDIGGTTTKSGLLTAAGVIAYRRTPTGAERGPDAAAERVAHVAAELARQASSDRLELVAAAVASPGIVDESSGVVRRTVNVGWRDRPIDSLLDGSVTCPTLLRHDVRSGALAEARFGAAAGRHSALFVPIGTGIAAAIVVGGEVLAGATAQAGEFGQIHVADGMRLEEVASARGMVDRYRELSASDGPRPGAGDIITRAEAGDGHARAVWAAAIDHLAAALAASVTTLDPEIVVIGGGLSRAGDKLLAPLRAGLSDALPWRSAPAIVAAHFGDDAGLVGAAISAWDHAGQPDADSVAAVLGIEVWPRLVAGVAG